MLKRRTQWLRNGTAVYYDRGYVGVGTSDPGYPLEVNGVIRGTSSFWYDAEIASAFTASPGASGATLIPPDANTLGGYRLDVSTEELYFNKSITSTWDGASDLSFRVTFEVNVNNTGGLTTDTVDLKIICYYKGHDELVNKTQTLEEPKIVGQSPQYKRFTTIFTIDWDATDNIVEVGDKMSFILNLETDTSEVDNVIINTVMFRYRTAKMNVEV